MVLSYENVLFDYYADALDYKTKIGSRFVDFDEFCKTYYDNNINIQLYTEGWKYTDTDNYQGYTFAENIPMIIPSSSDDADYILNSNNYDVTPTYVFKSKPSMKANLYSNLKVGDIIYETKTIFWNAGHNAVIVDLNKSSQSYGTYIETIEAVGGGVQHGFLDDDRVTRYGVKIVRVKNYFYYTNYAIEFMKRQLGKPYSLDIMRSNSSIDSSQWYCSELVWAAYYYAGIDLCTLDGSHHGDSGNTGGLLPYTIYACDYTYEVYMSNYFIRMSIVSKTGSKWKIQLVNSSSTDIFAKYNSKMCFLDDCVNWKKLSDLINIQIKSHSYVDVEIKENWFATSIVCGYDRTETDAETGDKVLIKYVSYADGLEETNKTMMVRYAII